MLCHFGGKREPRESENAGFHGGVTRRARTRRKVEGSRPARQEIGFVCEILRAESTSLTLRHLSHTRQTMGVALTGRPDRNLSRSDGERVYNGGITRAHLTPSIYSPIDWQLYNRQTIFNNP